MLSKFLISQCIPGKINPDDLESRKRLGMLSGIVGIFCNILLSIFKFFAGTITSSIAISADGFNNFSDAISSLVTLICFKTSNNPADKKHPFGYGRIEYISGLIVSIAIIFMGIELTKSSIEKLFSPENTTSDITAMVILLFSLIIKLWLGSFNKKLGNILNSSAMKATSFDSLGDAIITFTILISTIITYFTKISIDAYLGIGVALFIIFTGVNMIKETLSPLLGQSPDPDLVKRVYETVNLFPEILGIHELTVHNYGPGRFFLSFHAEVSANKNIMDIHEQIDNLEKILKNKFGCQAIIHMDPIVTDDKILNDMKKRIIEISQNISLKSKIYDLRIIPGNVEKLIFSISIPYDVCKTDQKICEIITRELEKSGEKYECSIDVTRNYFE